MTPRWPTVLVLAVVALGTLFPGVPATLAQATTIDYDQDNDGLIEVANLQQLNAMRWDLNGDGLAEGGGNFVDAFPNRGANPDGGPTMGCPSHTCTGYELTTDLDFDTNGNGRADAGDAYWNNGAGWEPIVDWTATFDGGYHTISNLFIDRPTVPLGLFGSAGGSAVIRNLGLIDVAISHSANQVQYKIGSLVGELRGGGKAAGVYATGTIRTQFGDSAGGLVGELHGSLHASWADVDISGYNRIGGLVGSVESGTGNVKASYALGKVTNTNRMAGGDNLSKGGLYGEKSALGGGTVQDSYFDSSVRVPSGGNHDGAQPISALQNPIGYTGIYANWNLDLDGDGTGDDPWDFGRTDQYPALKGYIDNDGNNELSWKDFGIQGRYDHKVVDITTSGSSITEGQNAEFIVSIHPTASQDVTVNLRVTSGGGDYGVTNGPVTVAIPAGQPGVIHSVPTVDDGVDDEAIGWVQVTSALPVTFFEAETAFETAVIYLRKPESTEGEGRVSVLKRQEDAPAHLG